MNTIKMFHKWTGLSEDVPEENVKAFTENGWAPVEVPKNEPLTNYNPKKSNEGKEKA